MDQKEIERWPFLLLILPIVFSVLALATGLFFFKGAVAGSCALILLFYFNRSMQANGDVWLIIAAFAFSIAGDWFLSNKGDNFLMFAAGIGLFFFAHVGYMGYALKNGSFAKMLTLAVLLGYLLFFILSLAPAIDNMVLKTATLIYLIISCLSLGAAAGIKVPPLSKWLYFFGITMILFSDTIIAMHEFVGNSRLSFLILPTYYLAQISVTLSVLIRKSGHNSKDS